MSPTEPSPRLLSLLSLSRTRATVRSSRGKAIVAGIGVAYGLVALLAGYMLELVRTGASGTTVVVLTNPYSPAWWNYPALIVITPGGVLALPFFATFSMVVVSFGVGLGMGAGLLVAVRFFRSWRSAKASGRPATSLAGMTPAMVAVLTLGACCSTSAAAAGGIGAVAVASGTTYTQILLNSWFLNVFQMVVLAIALLAQELLISMYDSLLQGSSESDPTRSARAMPTERSGRFPWLALRVFLVIGGTLWILALLIEATLPAPGTPLAGVVLGGLFQHVLLGGTAIAAGLMPTAVLGTFGRRSPRTAVRGGRWLLLVAGTTVAVGVPPPLNTWGLTGLGNYSLGSLGLPAKLGGVVPPGGVGLVPDLVIASLYALLGVFGMVVAVYPDRVLRGMTGGGRPMVESLDRPVAGTSGTGHEAS